MDARNEIPLTVAAQRLRFTWHRTWSRVLAGDLKGRQDERGRWFVDAGDVQRLLEERQARTTTPTIGNAA